MLKNRWMFLPWWCVLLVIVFGGIATTAIVQMHWEKINAEPVKKVNCTITGIENTGKAGLSSLTMSLICDGKELKSDDAELRDQFLTRLSIQKKMPIEMEAMLLKNGDVAGIKPTKGPVCQPNPCD